MRNPSPAQNRRRTLVAALLSLALLSPVAPGMAMRDPQAVIAYVGAQGMASLSANVTPIQRLARLRELLNDYFEVAELAEFALGRYRWSATPQQRAEYFRLYAEYTVRTYGAQLARYGPAPFRVTGLTSYGREVVVRSDLAKPDGGRIEIAWSLIANRRGNYKITDVNIGGISMRIAQRDDFARWIQNNGGRFDALLAVLRQQIAGI
jgi:phospholipid transport system substrate-binding protein